MNKKGFTVIELIVSFCLVTTISIILFQLIFSLKELYVSGDIKTTLLNKQGIMTKKIYDDINDNDIISITSCGVSCLTFTYSNNLEKNLLVDVAANTLTYDDYTMKLSEGSYFDQISFETYYVSDLTSTAHTDSVFNINIPIKSKFLKNEDFGIHIIKGYKSKEVIINNTIPLDQATLVANTIPLNLKYSNNDTEDKTDDEMWAEIFYQSQDGIDLNSTDAYFTNEEYLKSNITNNNKLIKKSSLKSLEVFRKDKNTLIPFNNENINLVDVSKEMIDKKYDSDTTLSADKKAKLKAQEKEKIDEEYQKGYLEFRLEYPNSTTPSNYNIWTQTSNFTTSDKIENAYIIDTMYQGSGCAWYGLNYNSQDKYFTTGCQGGTAFALGTKKAGISIAGEREDKIEKSVQLWINIDDYLKKYSLSVLTY